MTTVEFEGQSCKLYWYALLILIRVDNPQIGTLAVAPTIAELLLDEGCRKAVIRLNDGMQIETAFHYPTWLCVSSQAGCALGCRFCQTGRSGFARNLSSDEIVVQHQLAIEHSLGIDKTDPQSNFETISFSGMGEPLLNLKEVAKAMRTLRNVNQSQLHLSTVGILPQMTSLFELELDLSLDLSLHATTNEVRNLIIPQNQRYPLERILETIFSLNERRHFAITICYMLLKGVNDSDEDIKRLISLIGSNRTRVELKRFNSLDKQEFWPSDDERFQIFQSALFEAGITSYVWGNEGQSIRAGCGQLVWSID